MSVGPTRGPFQRPSDERDLTELFQRVEDLERARIALTESAAVWGSIIRDGVAGTMSITSGSLSATTTLVAHNVVQSEVGVDCDIVSSPTRITILDAGLYLVGMELVDLDTGAGDYGSAVGFGHNATGAVWSPVNVVRRVTGGLGRPQAIYPIELAAGDYVTQVVGQNSGVTKTFSYLATLKVVRIPGAFS